MKNEKDNQNLRAIVYALAAALFYALNVPCSKALLKEVPPTYMAAFLYLGAGIGVGVMYLIYGRKSEAKPLNRKDAPYVIGMIVLDIVAPILLMVGIRLGNASNASLLGNFEIVATSLIAFWFFREKISGRLWTAIVLVSIVRCCRLRGKGVSHFPQDPFLFWRRHPAGDLRITAQGESLTRAPIRL